MSNLRQQLQDLNACLAAIEWVDYRDHATAWAECQRGDWMLWVAARAGVDLRIVTRAKVECAKLVEHHLTDPRSINALRVAERFANGEATRDELKKADIYSYSAYLECKPDQEHASYSAFAAACYDADDDAACSTALAVAAADYIGESNFDDDYSKTLAECADICRKHIPLSAIKLGA